MTGLEMVLMVIIWVIVGCWISYKRDWYNGVKSPEMDPPQELSIAMNIFLAPIALLIAIFREFIQSDWKKSN